LLPELSRVLEFYTKLIEEEMDIDRANFYMAILVGYAALLWKLNLMKTDELSRYFDRIREEILEGPNQLNPYVMELFSILAEGLDDRNYEELISKLRMLLREERLDRLEV